MGEKRQQTAGHCPWLGCCILRSSGRTKDGSWTGSFGLLGVRALVSPLYLPPVLFFFCQNLQCFVCVCVCVCETQNSSNRDVLPNKKNIIIINKIGIDMVATYVKENFRADIASFA